MVEELLSELHQLNQLQLSDAGDSSGTMNAVRYGLFRGTGFASVFWNKSIDLSEHLENKVGCQPDLNVEKSARLFRLREL